MREGDTDVALDLRAVLGRGYSDGPFGSVTAPARPPLSESDATWAADLLRQPG